MSNQVKSTVRSLLQDKKSSCFDPLLREKKSSSFDRV